MPSGEARTICAAGTITPDGMTPEAAREHVRHFLEALFVPGDVFEVRALNCQGRGGYTYTCSGYFAFEAIERAVEQIDELDRAAVTPAVYVTLNPVSPALLARSANRIKTRVRETTKDADVVRRRWLLIDVDPVRPTGISATDAELAHAARLADDVGSYLSARGWSDPMVTMSGNGFHLLYRIDLPADDDGRVRRVLATLADRFNNEAATVDRSVHNPARIVKIAGTMSRRGDDLRGVTGVEDRPHRRARLIHVPNALVPVSAERLGALVDAGTADETTNARSGAPAGAVDAGPAQPAQPTPDTAQPAQPVVAQLAQPTPERTRFDCTPEGVRTWLELHGAAVKGERRNGEMTLILLERCPINPEIESTGGSDIAVLVGDDGRLAYCNKHNRGQHYTWQDLRKALDPDYEPLPVEADDVDLSALMPGAKRNAASAAPGLDEPAPELHAATPDPTSEPDPTTPLDPGPIPDDLLRVPGFVGEVMDHCLEIAPYPNPVLAFCGALALQAFLAGRKVRDPDNNRTNIYLLGLAYSSAGKDWPRKLNTHIIYEVGLGDCLADGFASGEGLQDALFVTPCMLFQTDEINGMLQSISRARDGRNENIMSTLLTMYSSSNSRYPMRRKAGSSSAGAIDQPNLVLFGTAIPNIYYEALSERMLTNGFFARMLVLESHRRSAGQDSGELEPPPRVLDTARWWADYRPGPGNLQNWHPEPTKVEMTPEAKGKIIDTRNQADAEYARAEADGDPVGTTVWGRVGEQARKLALLYAVSENHRSPRIGPEAVAWASRFVIHQIRRMLFMAAGHVASNEFDALCLKAIERLQNAPGRVLEHSTLLKRMKINARLFTEVIRTLHERGDIEVIEKPRDKGWPRRFYSLVCR